MSKDNRPTVVNLKGDGEQKELLDRACREMEIPVSTFTRIALRELLEKRGYDPAPFKPKASA